MCGIVGYIGPQPAVPVLMDGLNRLSYRGYDSAGIAVVNDESLSVRRAEGKVADLQEVLRLNPLTEGLYGIGHTRWATHGNPCANNAHPHCDCHGNIAVVHNGIIENHLIIKRNLGEGHTFTTETDSEVIAHLVEKHLVQDLEMAVRMAVTELQGSFAICVIAKSDPKKIVVARSGPPLFIGIGDGEYFVASDIPALLQHTRTIIDVNNNEMAVITPNGLQLTDFSGTPIQRQPSQAAYDIGTAEKGGYPHFMLKEIYEQPDGILHTMQGRIYTDGRVHLAEMGSLTMRPFRQILIVGCGTSYHAALVGQQMIQRLAKVPVHVDYASEFKYADPLVDSSTLTILISQSGETADTIAAGQEAASKGSPTLAICNVLSSQIMRAADGTLMTRAGLEISVASTKAFTAQLTALFILALHLGQIGNKPLDRTTYARMVKALLDLPATLQIMVDRFKVDPIFSEFATTYSSMQEFLYLGRGVHYPVALEGALKLKEISYIHAEGYPAGEMKHGPNALLSESLAAVVIATRDPHSDISNLLFDKTLSTIEQIRSRKGKVIAVVCEEDASLLASSANHFITIPSTCEFLLPILEVVPLQLIAYYMALHRGCDIDQPRNLAKSVTVE